MRRLAAALVALLLALPAAAQVAAQVAPHPVLAALPIARLDLPWWRARFAAKAAELRAAPPDLVFYGDSITEDYERAGPPAWRNFRPVWQRFYGDRHAANLGFKGDTTASLLWRLEHGEASGIHPRVAVVLIGANDFGRPHWSAADTLLGIDADVAAIRRHLPSTRILLLGILPSGRSAWVSANTATVNHALAAAYAHDPMVRFRDLSALFEHDGALDTALFLDPKLTPPEPPLHPDAEGQARMAAAIEPLLADWLGDRVHGAR